VEFHEESSSSIEEKAEGVDGVEHVGVNFRV
jgi:osmotically-inducible protein OsmY